MPTLIDSLILELKLDVTGFTEGQKKAADAIAKTRQDAQRGTKDLGDNMDKVGVAFQELQKKALAFLGVFTAAKGLKEFIADLTRMDAETGRAALGLNMSADELARWQGVARQFGGSAQGITGILQHFTAEIQSMALTGESTMVPILRSMGINMKNTNGQFKTGGQLLLDIAKRIQVIAKTDPSRGWWLGKNLGLDEATLALMIKHGDQFDRLVEEQKKLTNVTKEDTDAALNLQKAWERVDLAWENLGRKIKTYFTDPLLEAAKAAEMLARWLQDPTGTMKETPTGKEVEQAGGMEGWKKKKWQESIKWMEEHGIPVPDWLKKHWGIDPATGQPLPSEETPGAPAQSSPAVPGAPAQPTPSPPGTSTEPGPGGVRIPIPPASRSSLTIEQKEAIIRREAKKNSIDPEVALRVARSEGLFKYVGDKGTSFGAFQLHVGGGLGDIFKQQTGLDPSDPATEEAQINFAMAWAAKHGWGPWHGWKGQSWHGIGMRLPSAAEISNSASSVDNSTTSNVETSFGDITIHTNATDAAGIAKDLRSHLERQSYGLSMNSNLGLE